MDTATYRAHLQREIASFAAGLESTAADPALMARPVSGCPGWNLRDLTHHLVGLHYWVIDAVTGERGSNPFGKTDPPDGTDLVAAFAESSATLLEVLDADPETPCWTIADPGNVGFWQRRQPQEHSIHRWDLEIAVDLPAGPGTAALDPGLADDGIDEIVAMFWPRQVALGRATPPTTRLEIRTDTGSRWLIGDPEHPGGPVVASVAGPAPALLLALWKRYPADHPELSWSGDAIAGREILALKLAP
ncbi:MAG: maleylpyruvate isomerase family mycothiol-dependent enzyme [Nocardioides sp.]